jgi:hypothetical protein
MTVRRSPPHGIFGCLGDVDATWRILGSEVTLSMAGFSGGCARDDNHVARGLVDFSGSSSR